MKSSEEENVDLVEILDVLEGVQLRLSNTNYNNRNTGVEEHVVGGATR